MRDPYIERRAAQAALFELPTLLDAEAVQRCIEAITHLPGADVVARDCFNRILRENDVARGQLAEIGKKIGDKMDDVRTMVHAHWVHRIDHYECSECREDCWSEDAPVYDFCPSCGWRFVIFAADEEMKDLVAERGEIQKQIRVARIGNLRQKTVRRLVARQNKLINAQKKRLRELKPRAERLLREANHDKV